MKVLQALLILKDKLFPRSGRFGVIYLERLVSLSKITYTYSEQFHEKTGNLTLFCVMFCTHYYVLVYEIRHTKKSKK